MPLKHHKRSSLLEKFQSWKPALQQTQFALQSLVDIPREGMLLEATMRQDSIEIALLA